MPINLFRRIGKYDFKHRASYHAVLPIHREHIRRKRIGMNRRYIMNIHQHTGRIRRVPIWALGVAMALAVACNSEVPAATLVPIVPEATETPPTPNATAIPTPTLTPPTPTPTAAPTVVATDSDQLGALAFDYVETLSVDLSTRTSASAGELATAEFLQNRMSELGYDSDLQDFEFEFLQQGGEFIQFVGSGEPPISARMVVGSFLGTAEGMLVDIGLGGFADIPIRGLEGAIAFADRGIIPFETKARNAANAGAIAIIIANSAPGPVSATFGRQFDFLALSISGIDGDQIRSRMEEGPVSVRLEVAPQTLQSRNVVSTMPSDSDDIVIMGAHFDTVPRSPGANDNASGVATVLTIAEQIADRNLPFELRVVFFGSEELGLFGSQHYLNSLTPDEAARVAFMINLDALGSGQLELFGDAGLVAAAQIIASDLDIPVRRGVIPANSSSDHAPFEAAGIPILMLFGSDFTDIHSPQDTLDKIQPGILGAATAIVVEGLRGRFKEPAVASVPSRAL
jgi:aminopeptidase YwaD